MGGSSIIPNILNAVPSVAEKVSPMDQMVIRFMKETLQLQVELPIHLKRFERFATSTKLLYSYTDLLNLRDNLLNDYKDSARAPNLKIKMTCGRLQKSKEYRQITREAEKQLKIAWDKVTTEINTNLIPRVLSLEQDFCNCIDSYRAYVLAQKNESLLHEYRDEEICDKIEFEVIPLLEFSDIGLTVLKQQLMHLKQPSTTTKKHLRGQTK